MRAPGPSWPRRGPKVIGSHERTRRPVVREPRGATRGRYLLDGGFSSQALSRSYYAVFYAASASVRLRSEHPKTHAGLITRFAKLVVVEGGFDPDVGAILRELFGDRIVVDYETLDMGSEEARRALERAERFVDAVEAWIAAQPSGEGS